MESLPSEILEHGLCAVTQNHEDKNDVQTIPVNEAKEDDEREDLTMQQIVVRGESIEVELQQSINRAINYNRRGETEKYDGPEAVDLNTCEICGKVKKKTGDEEDCPEITLRLPRHDRLQ